MGSGTVSASRGSRGKHPKVPRSDVTTLSEVLDRVNGEVRRAGRVHVARTRIATALMNVIERCDAIEDLGDDIEKARQLAEGLADALKPVEGRLVKVRLFPVGRRTAVSSDSTDDRSGVRHLFKIHNLMMIGQETDEELYLGFAQAIGQLDDLRRIRRCDRYEKFYVRTKVQRQAHHFCCDDCRRAFHNIGKQGA